jgi:hypothetical protein
MSSVMVNGGKEYLVFPLLEATVDSESGGGFIQLDKATAFRILNGAPIPAVRTMIELKRYTFDDNNQIRTDSKGNPILETITDHVTSIRIGILKWSEAEEKEL